MIDAGSKTNLSPTRIEINKKAEGLTLGLFISHFLNYRFVTSRYRLVNVLLSLCDRQLVYCILHRLDEL